MCALTVGAAAASSPAAKSSLPNSRCHPISRPALTRSFGPPPAPTGLVAGPDSYVGVSLSWNAVSGATSYNVKRSNTSGGPFTTIASRATPDYNDTNVIAGNIYYYVVSAVNTAGESANS